MKVFRFATCLALCFSLSQFIRAQQLTPAYTQSRSANQSVVGTEDRGGVLITNNYESSLTGFLITVDLGGHGRNITRIYFDIYVENYGLEPSIRKGYSRLVPLPHGDASSPDALPTPTLRAAVFQDGTTFGDSTWVDELLRRRAILSDRLAEVSGLLRSISDQKMEKSEALDFIQKRRQARIQENADASLEERLIHDRIYHTAIRNLDGRLRVGGKVPSAPVAAHYLALYLDRWKSAIEPVTGPPSASSRMHSNAHGDRSNNIVVMSMITKTGGPRQATMRLASSKAPVPQGSCTVRDASVLFEGPDECGNEKWFLVSKVGSNAYFENFWWTFGQCTGGYLDCTGNSVPPDYSNIPPLISSGVAPGAEYYFYWQLGNFTAEYDPCNCNAPYPGTIEVVIENVYYTPVYYGTCGS